MIRKMSRKHALVGLAAAGVLGVGIAAPTVALADDKSPAPSASASADQGTDRQQQRADRQAEFADALAKELGVSTDKVTAALEKLKEQHKADRPERPSAKDRQEKLKDWQANRQAQLKERLDQAVKDGKLTQEQADAVLKAVAAGVSPGRGARGHHGGWDQAGK
jgi:DNA-binding transcriptional MerR regulator